MAKEKYWQVRADDNDRAMAKRLADDYGVNISALFRFALTYIDAKRPALTMTITPQRKSRKAPATPRNGTEGAP